ncbi:Phenazine biosynthesis PhzF protein [Raphanus sativus]|nr:Phenazine biosynthesis PhzF protein [Raphanus sativus]
MKKPVKYFVVDAFTESAFKGNQAAVCFLEKDHERDDSWLQLLAAEFDLPLTCFLTPITGSDPLHPQCFLLRWFTSVAELDTCLLCLDSIEPLESHRRNLAVTVVPPDLRTTRASDETISSLLRFNFDPKSFNEPIASSADIIRLQAHEPRTPQPPTKHQRSPLKSCDSLHHPETAYEHANPSSHAESSHIDASSLQTKKPPLNDGDDPELRQGVWCWRNHKPVGSSFLQDGNFVDSASEIWGR